MLGRHVYRVHANGERWSVTKEGEEQPRGDFSQREAALSAARRLADGDKPSRVTVDNGDGVILEEHLFGEDLADRLDATG